MVGGGALAFWKEDFDRTETGGVGEVLVMMFSFFLSKTFIVLAAGLCLCICVHGHVCAVHVYVVCCACAANMSLCGDVL